MHASSIACSLPGRALFLHNAGADPCPHPPVAAAHSRSARPPAPDGASTSNWPPPHPAPCNPEVAWCQFPVAASFPQPPLGAVLLACAHIHPPLGCWAIRASPQPAAALPRCPHLSSRPDATWHTVSASSQRSAMACSCNAQMAAERAHTLTPPCARQRAEEKARRQRLTTLPSLPQHPPLGWRLLA